MLRVSGSLQRQPSSNSLFQVGAAPASTDEGGCCHPKPLPFSSPSHKTLPIPHPAELGSFLARFPHQSPPLGPAAPRSPSCGVDSLIQRKHNPPVMAIDTLTAAIHHGNDTAVIARSPEQLGHTLALTGGHAGLPELPAPPGGPIRGVWLWGGGSVPSQH